MISRRVYEILGMYSRIDDRPWLPTQLAIFFFVVSCLFVILVISHFGFHFGFDGGIRRLIALIPVHCFLITFLDNQVTTYFRLSCWWDVQPNTTTTYFHMFCIHYPHTISVYDHRDLMFNLLAF